jgi:hypothetical protein
MWLLVYDRFAVTIHVSFVNTQKLIYTNILHVFCLIKQQTRLNVVVSLNCYMVRTIYAVNHILDYNTMSATASSLLFSDIINRLYDT